MNVRYIFSAPVVSPTRGGNKNLIRHNETSLAVALHSNHARQKWAVNKILFHLKCGLKATKDISVLQLYQFTKNGGFGGIYCFVRAAHWLGLPNAHKG